MSEMKDPPAVEVRLDVPYGGGVSGTLCNDLYLPKKQRRRVDQEPNTTGAPVLLRFLEKALR